MSDDDAALIARQAARIQELQTWLGILVVQFGERNGVGYRHAMCSSCADGYRQALSDDAVRVAISYDIAEDQHVVDVM